MVRQPEKHTFPIPDRGVPSSRKEAEDFIEKLVAAIEAGKSVAIHCRQSIGRSALLAASLFASFGVGADDAFRAVEKARGCPVPDTSQQRIWVEAFAESGR